MALPLHSKYVEIHRKLYKHLDFGGDGMEVVVKGHLLLENMLQEILASASTDRAALASGRLTYFQSACVVKAVFSSRCPAWVWKAVFDLNAIRNRVAHDLECQQLPELIEQFDEYVEGQESSGMEFGQELGFARFPMAIVTVHAQLWTLLKSNVA